MGYDAIVIFGDPANYISSGFRSCKNTASALRMGVIRPLCWSKKPGAFSGKNGGTAAALHWKSTKPQHSNTTKL